MQTRSAVREVLERAYRKIAEREKAFREFVERLCASGLTSEVYLVGSRARGDSTPSSDYDIVIVVDQGDLLDVAEKVALLKKEPVPVDVVVLRRGDLEDPLYREMLMHKKKLC